MKNNKKQEIIDLFKKHNNFVISSHVHLDGDAIGSELALYSILKQLKKDVLIINQDQLPEIYRFLPNTDKIICASETSFSYINNAVTGKNNFKPVLIVLDSSNLDRIGNIFLDISNFLHIVNIDHHSSNSYFGDFNFVQPKASSVGEIIFNLAQKMDSNIHEDITIPIYTAITTDTGSFRYSNTSAKTFNVAAKLVTSGAVPDEIANNIYKNAKLSSLKILGTALSNLKIDSTGNISWTAITRDMLADANANDEDVEGIVDKILSVKGIQIAVFFRETPDNSIKISFRSKGSYNVDYFARKFGGGGHPNAAGCQINGILSDVIENVLKKLQQENIF
ncbi:MAG: bifunctional oligoribonuclease/PAP phosphatase NrnA [Atribacterota bacterium]|nr:bifunctional oligoribonuclease/PAP phosphatase NrnA [Atribacterota bacterium]